MNDYGRTGDTVEEWRMDKTAFREARALWKYLLDVFELTGDSDSAEALAEATRELEALKELERVAAAIPAAE